MPRNQLIQYMNHEPSAQQAIEALSDEEAAQLHAITIQLPERMDLVQLILTAPILLSPELAPTLNYFKQTLCIKNNADTLKALNLLYMAGLLNQEIGTLYHKSTSLLHRAKLIIFLHKEHLLNENRHHVSISYPNLLLKLLLTLKKNHRLTPENITACFQYQLSRGFITLIENLFKKGQLNEQRLLALLNHPHRNLISSIFNKALGLDFEILCEYLLSHYAAHNKLYIFIIEALWEKGLLNQANVDMFIDQKPIFYELAQHLSYLKNMGLLTQENYELLIKHRQILTHSNLFLKISTAHVTIWQEIFTICKTQNTMEIKNQLITQIFSRNTTQTRYIQLNPAQSTHNTATHCGSEFSLWLLYLKYPHIKESTELLLKEIQTRIEDSTHVHKEAALKTIKNIRALQNNSLIHVGEANRENFKKLVHSLQLNDIESLQEPIQKLLARETISLSLKKSVVFALFYKEIKDLPDSIDQFISALYEIHRGYNLDEYGNENNAQAKALSICLGSYLNKFCEKLSSLSPAIIFIYVEDMSVSHKIKTILLKYIHQDIEQEIDMSVKCKALQALSQPESCHDALEYYWGKYLESIRAEIHQEYNIYVSINKLNMLMTSYHDDILAYMPTPIEANANVFYTISFSQWFSYALKTTQPSSSQSHVYSSSLLFTSALRVEKRSFTPDETTDIDEPYKQSRMKVNHADT